MKSTKSPFEALLILGDQLFPPQEFKKFEGMKTFMAEDIGLCTHFRYHKKKLVLFLSAMRHFYVERKDDLEISYFKLTDNDQNFSERLSGFLKSNQIQKLHHFEIEDKFFEKEIESLAKELDIELISHQTPSFMVSRPEFKNYLSKTKKPFLKTFYESQRRAHKILLDKNGGPVGGEWSFDKDNRKPYRTKTPPPKINWFDPDEVSIKVMELVKNKFLDHPGDAHDFCYPVTRKDAQKWLDQFLSERFSEFGPFEDAIHTEHHFLFHSLLSPLINLGLLTPKEVLDKAILHFEKSKIPIQSVEGFVRQILGWREFVRGIYRNFSEEQETRNFWKHERKLTSAWYTGTTGLPPLDDCIRKASKHGYTHHIERLMIVSNIMQLSEIDPKEAHRWFMEMYVDSADWVMGPNVYGMGLFSDGGIFSTKPYICASHYILKMSNYKKGPWCETLDALFWRFIHKHKDFFIKQHRLGMLVKSLEKKSKAEINQIYSKAEKFIETQTT